MAVGAVFFDLFGTLLSLAPLDDACDRLAPGRGAEIAARWRARQLEASWLRTAMERWADFDVVTREALRATLEELGHRASRDDARRRWPTPSSSSRSADGRRRRPSERSHDGRPRRPGS